MCVTGSRKVSHESLIEERGDGHTETYFTSQGHVTQITSKLKQEVKSTVFHVTKPKLDFFRAQPTHDLPTHDLPMPSVLEGAFDAGRPQVSFLSYVSHCLRRYTA